MNWSVSADQCSPPVEMPDWTSYEEIEPYIRRDYGRLFWRVIPVKLRSYVFAPTDAAAANLRAYRQSVSAEYESILTFIAGSWSQPKQHSDGSSAHGFDNFLESVIENPKSARLITSLTPFYSCQTLNEYHVTLVGAIERYESAIQRCERLLTEPEAAFLRETERQDLEAIQKGLIDTVDSAQQCIEVIARARRQIDRCERRLSDLSDQAAPYLGFTTLLSDDTLIAEANSLHDEAVAARQTSPIEHLPHSERIRIENCAEQAATLSQRLQDSQALFADMHAMRLRELSVFALAMFEGRDQPVGTPDSQPEVGSAFHMTVDELQTELVAFASGPSPKYVADHRVEELDRYESALSEQTECLQNQLATWQDELHDVDQQAAEYIKLEEYLQDDSLIDRVDRLESEIAAVLEKTPLSIFAHGIVREFATIDRRTSQLKQELKKSRGRFARSEIQQLEQQCVTILDGFEAWSGNHIEREIETRSLVERKLSIGNRVSAIAEFLTAPYRVHVDDHRIDLLLQLQEELARQELAVAKTVETINQRLKTVEQDASPYLELEEYLESDDLLETIWGLQGKITSLRNQAPLKLVTDQVYDEFQNVERGLSSLLQNLRDSRRRFAMQQHERACESVNETLTEIQSQLEPAKKEGKSIESPDVIRETLEEAHTEIEQTRTAPWGTHLTDDELAMLNELDLQVSNQEEFIAEKLAFDEKLDSQKENYEALRAEAAPYLEYDRYLTDPARAELTDSIEDFKSEVDSVASEIQFELLADADRDRLYGLKQDAIDLRSHLTDYNRVFVMIQRQECTSLFSGIGPNNLDLTEQQERAVIRNGIYNQVIAAAGTGKTLALTTRVAYLVHQQGISPERILVVTYTNEATDEMEDRLEHNFGITGAEVRTIHSFGYRIIQEAKSDYVEAIDSTEIINFIDGQIRNAREATTSTFLDHFYQFLVHFDDVYYDEADFETRQEYVETRAAQEYVTLKGTEVKSRAEKLIADFLYIHQVEYQYEDRATWATSASDKAGYTPDFYLPDDDLYIEHWGIDETGSVAPWFTQSSAEYRDKMEWAREQFEGTAHELVGTYEFEHEAGRLRQVLSHRLSLHNVELNQMSFEELVDTAFEYNNREGWIKSRLKQFLMNAKRFDVKPDAIKENLNPDNPRQYHFGQCGIHLLKEYVLYLHRNELVDFTDMIQDAVELVQANQKQYSQRYDHILVDEFQDVGKGVLDLIRELTGEVGAKLFAVGDDWQSIYSFQGAVIEYFTNFAEHFGDPVRTDLTVNFRSPEQIVSAGNSLIDENSGQLDKTVEAWIEHDSVPRVHPVRGYQFFDYVRRVRQYTVDLVREYCDNGTDPADIMILCRYDDAVPYLDEIKDGLQSQNIPYVGKSDQYRGPNGQADDGVSVYSLYQAKGREAERVILIHAAEGPFGFPSEGRDSELLEPVQPLSLGGIEEERRAFYVAITRAERTLDILTRGGQESRFLDEIDESTTLVDTGKVEPLDDPGELMSVTAQVDKLLDPWNKQHQRGILADKHGGSARFVSWQSGDPPTLHKGEWYNISGARVNQFKDEKELILSNDCSIEELENEPTIAKLIGFED